MRTMSRLSSIWLLATMSFVDGKQCDANDFVYEYSACDHKGQRWRVALPKTHSIQCDNIPPPKSGLNCSFSCPSGHYLNMESQQCEACRAGTYSLGDGVRYQDFDSMPEGFTTETFVDESNQMYSVGSSVGSCPLNSGWAVLDGEIRYNPTPCVSRLSISLHLIKDGYVEIYYQLPKNRHSLVSELTVRNEQCESYGSPSIFKKQRPVDENMVSGSDWHLRRFNVRRGQNLIIWTVSSNRDLTTLADVIRVTRVDIVGLAFTPKCTECPAGSFSPPGSVQCFGCQAGSYSQKGSASCTACGINEYSGPKAARCLVRPRCTSLDYYPRFGTCSNGQVERRWTRIKPEVCASATALPNPDAGPCQRCNAGESRGPRGECQPCKQDSYSDGLDCAKCGNGTIPEFGLFVSQWEHMPDLMSSSCEYMISEDMGECPVTIAWIPLGNRIESATTRARGVALELALNITYGFYDPLRDEDIPPSADDPIARVDLDLETRCHDETCQLYIVLVEMSEIAKNGGFRFLETLNGPAPRKVRSYAVVRNTPVRIVIAFMRSGAALGQDAIDDKAIVYSMNVTNVADRTKRANLGGARACRQCPFSGQDGKCKPCPQGQFVQQGTNKCVSCPPGTVLNATSDKAGLENCVRCPENMGSVSKTECGFTGLLKVQLDGRNAEFDMTPLKNVRLTANGIKVFPRDGSPYFHTFNVSIFHDSISCKDTYDSNLLQALDVPLLTTAGGDSMARFCRATAIPTPKMARVNDSVETESYVSSYIISTKLASITTSKSYKGYTLSDKQLEYDLSAKSSTKPIDLHFFFEPSPGRSISCPNGTIGVVTTRCEPLAVTNPEVRLSRSCPDGTCDGCLFHVIIESSFACPICDPSDFEEIKGECLEGKQKIHSIPSKHCVLTGMQSRQRVESCSVMSSNIEVTLFLAAVLILFLVLVICVIHRRNKRLEYRYMRIVEGKDQGDANSCGLQSDESEDEDDDAHAKVFFNKNKEDGSVRVSSKKSARKGALLEDQDSLSDSS